MAPGYGHGTITRKKSREYGNLSNNEVDLSAYNNGPYYPNMNLMAGLQPKTSLDAYAGFNVLNKTISNTNNNVFNFGGTGMDYSKFLPPKASLAER